MCSEEKRGAIQTAAAMGDDLGFDLEEDLLQVQRSKGHLKTCCPIQRVFCQVDFWRST